MGRGHNKAIPTSRVAFLVAIALSANPASSSDSKDRASKAQAGTRAAALRVDSDLVEIPVTVVDHSDRIVDSLSVKSFSLYEDGIEQTIAHFGSYDGPISTCVLFDSSGSMARKLNRSIEAVKELLGSAVSGDDFCLVRFDNRPETMVGITDDPARITAALSRIYPTGWTALLDGISVGVEEVKRGRNSRKVIILISDGGDNRSRQTPQQIKRLVREAAAQIYSIGIVDADDRVLFPTDVDGPTLMKKISGESGGRLFLIRRLGELPSVIEKIMLAVRYQYLLGYYPQSVRRDGRYRRVTVKVRPPEGTPKVRAYWRGGYYGPND
jgi:Ca-activated chloride channel family protein